MRSLKQRASRLRRALLASASASAFFLAAGTARAQSATAVPEINVNETETPQQAPTSAAFRGDRR